MDVRPMSSYSYSVQDEKNGGADLPILAVQRKGQKQTHHLGQKQVYTRHKEVQASQ